MIIFCNCHLNLNNFQIVCHKATSQENVMGFQIQIWLPVMKQDIISFMSTVEDTRTKSMLITHFGRHNNWIGKCIIYQLSYEILDIIMKIWPFITPIMTILFSTYCPNRTSQVTYVTMVPRMGNETLRPLGVATGNALSVTRVWRYICKNTTCWPATAHDVTTGMPQYKCRRENTSSASSSEACIRSMAQSLGDTVSRSPFGEPWLHT